MSFLWKTCTRSLRHWSKHIAKRFILSQSVDTSRQTKCWLMLTVRGCVRLIWFRFNHSHRSYYTNWPKSVHFLALVDIGFAYIHRWLEFHQVVTQMKCVWISRVKMQSGHLHLPDPFPKTHKSNICDSLLQNTKLTGHCNYIYIY